jgi:hypothetical protein
MPDYDPSDLWRNITAGAQVPITNTSASGLVLPGFDGARTSIRSAWTENVIAVYLIAREYLEVTEASRGRVFDRDTWITTLLAQHSEEEYLRQLAALNHAAIHDDLISQYQERFLAQLTPAAADIVRRRLAENTDGRPRRFIARQMVLRAIRLVLVPPVREQSQLPDNGLVADLANVGPEAAAVFLIHLAADAFTQEERDNEPKFAGFPISLAKELIANNLFNENDDIGDLIARHRLLWKTYGSRLQQYKTRRPPTELLQEATGLELDDLMVLGFCFYGYIRVHRPDSSVAISAHISSEITISEATIEKFLNMFSSSGEELKTAWRDCSESWQMWPIQERPLLRIDDEVLILDELYMIERITLGLYWLVHDNEKCYSEAACLRWRQAYGEIIEARAEDQIRHMAPPLLGNGSTFFTEEALKVAFPKSKNCDAGIDFGSGIVLMEVVSGTVKRSTREPVDIKSFCDDTEKIVLKKARQLDDTANNLLLSPQPKKSPILAPAIRIYPVIICGGQYPVNPVTINYIKSCVASEGLFQDGRVQPLAILDLECLEACESLHAQRGTALIELLGDWMQSPYSNSSFRVYLVSKYGGQSIGRPDVINSVLAEWFTVLKERFRH